MQDPVGTPDRVGQPRRRHNGAAADPQPDLQEKTTLGVGNQLDNLVKRVTVRVRVHSDLGLVRIPHDPGPTRRDCQREAHPLAIQSLACTPCRRLGSHPSRGTHRCGPRGPVTQHGSQGLDFPAILCMLERSLHVGRRHPARLQQVHEIQIRLPA